MIFGRYEISLVDDGRFGLDGGSMFGIVPRHAWSKLMPPDAENRVDMTARVVVARGQGRVVLIDAGIGNKVPKKLADRMDVRRDGGAPGELSGLGIGPEDVTDVIVSHMHFDHAGGLTTQVGCEIVPTYPKARIHVQRACFEWARRPTQKDAASFMAHDIEPLIGSPNLNLLDGDCDVLPGISVISTNGHMPGTQVVVIGNQRSAVSRRPEARSLKPEAFAFVSDLVPTAHHLRLPYIMAYDVAPLSTLSEKKAILARALEGDWVVCFAHDRNTPACTLKRNQKGEITAGEQVAL